MYSMPTFSTEEMSLRVFVVMFAKYQPSAINTQDRNKPFFTDRFLHKIKVYSKKQNYHLIFE